ncbi:hypothetical protein KEJ15_05925, partial [Candidatus Bathyarchaeota archaeon]|nr:hypothetical protein [Candidatus Bathyarchaeota archaeon]
LGLLFSTRYFRVLHSYTELVAVGLTCGYAGAIIISYLELIDATLFLILIYFIVKRAPAIRKNIFNYALFFGISLLPLSPFLYRFIAFYSYPGHNIGIASDFGGWPSQQLHLTQALQWALENLSPNLLLRAMIFGLIFGLGLLIWKTKNTGGLKPVMALAVAIFTAGTALSLVSFVLGGEFGIISWGHQGILFSVAINMLIAAFLIRLLEAWRNGTFPFKSPRSNIFLLIMLLSLMTGPFVGYRFVAEPADLRGGYEMFAVTTQTDYDLIMWMKENLTTSAAILVNQYDAGLFIPTLSHHKIVLPWGGSSYSRSYQRLVGLLANHTLNATTYQLMQYWNVTHIYVGGRVMHVAPRIPEWNQLLFLGNPNFRIAKNIEYSYLFELYDQNPAFAFLEDFEHEQWNQNWWKNDLFGKGIGNATVKEDLGYNGSSSLMLTAQATSSITDWDMKCAYRVYREIFVQNNSDVAFSFYLNATEGFSGNDTFAVMISDSLQQRSLVFATQGGIFTQKSIIQWNITLGVFEYNISDLWRQRFSTPLPSSFILQFVSYDFDGVRNIVYLDNIEVRNIITD